MNSLQRLTALMDSDARDGFRLVLEDITEPELRALLRTAQRARIFLGLRSGHPAEGDAICDLSTALYPLIAAPTHTTTEAE